MLKLSLVALLLAGASLSAQEKPKDPKDPKAAPAAAAPRPEGLPGRPAEGEPKPYDKVVTSEFQTQSGLFRTHVSKGKVLLEIPKPELGKDLLLVTQVKKSPAGTSYPGQSAGNHVVRWELRENKVLLRAISYANIADPANPVAKAVEAMNTGSIIMAFNVEAFAKDGSPVIEATRLFTSDVNEIPFKRAVQGLSVDPTRSFVDKVRTFPENLNVEATQTFIPKPATLPLSLIHI